VWRSVNHMTDEAIELPVLVTATPPDGEVLFETITRAEMEDGSIEGQVVYDPDPPLMSTAQGFLLSPKGAAERRASMLKTALLDHGVPQVSIELLPGGDDNWNSVMPRTEMSHHTVSRYNSRLLTPCLSLVRRGRGGSNPVPGPLANGYGGWDLTYRIITFGRANHAGEGGPMRVMFKGDRLVIPRDNANAYGWGTEWEGGLDGREWNRELRNPRNGKKMTMREFMGRTNAGLRDFFGLSDHAEHSTWTNRKIDRLNYTAAEGTAELRPYLKENDVDQADIAKIAEAVMDAPIPNKDADGKVIGTSSLRKMLTNIESDQERIGGRDRQYRQADRELLERIARKVGVSNP
jgi:hypothetical protein